MAFTITIQTPQAVQLPAATVGVPYSYTFNAVSSAGSIRSWQTVDSSGKAIGYSVPAPGLKWGGVNATVHGLTITGTPTTALSQTFVFKVTDSAGNAVITPPYTLSISSPVPATPDLISAQPGVGEVTLSWSEPA